MSECALPIVNYELAQMSSSSDMQIDYWSGVVFITKYEVVADPQL